MAGLVVVTLGAGWAVAVDGISYLAAALLVPVEVPAVVRGASSSTLRELTEGWTFLRSTTWLWAVVLAFGTCAVHQGAYFTLGQVLAKGGGIGETG